MNTTNMILTGNQTTLIKLLFTKDRINEVDVQKEMNLSYVSACELLEWAASRKYVSARRTYSVDHSKMAGALKYIIEK